MDKRFGYFIFGGMIIGALLGMMWTAGGNTVYGILTGALAGASIGWFGAAAVMEKEKEQKKANETRDAVNKRNSS